MNEFSHSLTAWFAGGWVMMGCATADRDANNTVKAKSVKPLQKGRSGFRQKAEPFNFQ